MLLSSSIVNVFVPVRLPLFDNEPSKAGVNFIFLDNTSDVFAESLDTDPTPSSIVWVCADTIYCVICLVVLCTVIFALSSTKLLWVVTELLLIGVWAVDSISTSPNNLNPAGCVVSFIKDLQVSIGVFDLIKYEKSW